MSGERNRIKSVRSGSPAERAGVRPGDKLLSIDGRRVTDVLDYMYYAYDEESLFELERDGEKYAVTLEKEAGEDAGLDFEDYLMDGMRSCANNCVFCFVDQMPKGMRESLYFKDDDVRLSFLTGSYLTLTNMSEREAQRVIDLRISPINVSVHTMDPKLRCLMLGNKNAGRGIEILKSFARSGIELNCQIVCCPGLNDGRELTRTMRRLARLSPSVKSVSVIPVGLTKYREGLYPLTPFDGELAKKTVEQVEKYSERCLRRHGSRIFFCSDEMYLKAGLPVPPEEFYEGYPQLENGVGLLRLLYTDFEEALARSEGPARGTRAVIATGVSAAKTLTKLRDMARAKYPNVNVDIIPIVNDFFGSAVDVAGLITGGDLIAQLKGKDLGEGVYITNRMLRDGERVFLDDVTVEDASLKLGVPVTPIENGGGPLLEAFLS